jgi:hypothetical protein
VADDAPAAGNFFLARVSKAELLQNAVRCGMSFFGVGQNAGQAQAIERGFNEGGGSLGSKASAPVRLCKVVADTCVRSILSSAESTTADVFVFFFKDCRPQAVCVRWASEIFSLKTMEGFLDGPRRASHKPPHFRIGVHGDEGVLVPRFVPPEQQPRCLQKNHFAGQLLRSLESQSRPPHSEERGQEYCNEKGNPIRVLES